MYGAEQTTVPAAGGGDADAAPASTAGAAASMPPPAAGGFKQRKNRGNLRKRAADEGGATGGGGGEDDETEVVRKAKQTKGDPLAFSTKKESKEDVVVTYASSQALPIGGDSGATRILETETEFDRDARARRERVLQQGAEGGGQGDGTYKGMTGYTDYRAGFRREQTVGSEKGAGAHGPLRASAYVRVSARFDYQPDLCKDYKETGFCSYGDACKFMHDRGDYKSGWELEREWEEEQKRRQEALTKGWAGEDGEEGEGGGGHGEEEEDDELPFACYICRKPWGECKSDPVVTKCKHYFCESCALKHNAKTGKCATCEQPTQGIFNLATDVIKKMKRLKDKEGAAVQ
ncbi:RING finger protein [Monoraphidium neglectum]|uniref:RING finger protein n=1 Tax=Monoraphidium neglectum TaxID=145388 RepID=A0A0D2M3F8_9CHLO|nr:RING finger protein [Monoraphidium neglectum]KIY98104.1 RING finger protein [Monoraphidium neglectum]|eukprot:XP_013897124.1 RING finger protein [Monoraphidium neglectum]